MQGKWAGRLQFSSFEQFFFYEKSGRSYGFLPDFFFRRPPSSRGRGTNVTIQTCWTHEPGKGIRLTKGAKPKMAITSVIIICFALCVLCSVLCIPSSVLCALCSVLRDPTSVLFAFCFVPYALHSDRCAFRSALCVLYSATCALCVLCATDCVLCVL